MALDYREVTIPQAARIIGCSEVSVRTLVKRGHIGVMRYLTSSDGKVRKMLSQEDVELVAEQRTFNAFGMEYRGVAVFGRDDELKHAAASSLRISGFRVDICVTALCALSCVKNGERPVLIECGPSTSADDLVLLSCDGLHDCYSFRKAEELRPLVRWAWDRVNARYEALKALR